jgi:sugar lactone lactonase YvrE
MLNHRRCGVPRVLAIGGLLSVFAFAATVQAALAFPPTYSLSAFAGTGTVGTPTAGAATSSHLHEPDSVAVDSAGNVYVADTQNDDVERVTPSGTLSIIAGNGVAGTPTPGPATSSHLNEPTGVAVDSSGNVYIANDESYDVAKVTPSGALSIVAGNGTKAAPVSGTAVNSPLGEVWGVAVDSSGNVYISDGSEQVIEKVTASGQLSIFAGTVGHVGTPTSGPATASHFAYPSALATDSEGNLYIADYENARIEKITPSGTLSVIAGDGSFAAPTPGPATSSALWDPIGVAVDAAGDVYIADTSNNDIEAVTPGHTLSIIAGKNTAGAPTYGGPATSSDLDIPEDIASTAAGRLYVADSYNYTIDLLTPPVPTASAVPTVTGTTMVGDTLTASQGTFTNSPVTYTYQWEDCDSAGANCTVISGASSSTYAPVASDAGHTIRVVVTAANGGGSTTSTSAPTAAIVGLATAPTLTPTLTPTLALPSDLYTVMGARAGSNGTIVMTVAVHSPGELNLLGTHVKVRRGATAAALLEPGYRRLAWGEVTVRANAPGEMTVTLHPNTAGKRLLARHREHGWALNVRVWTTYTPTGGKPRSVARTVKMLSARLRR